MNKLFYGKLTIHFVIFVGLILFTAGLFWESSQTPTWAAQVDPGPPGTAPTRPPDNDDDQDDDDDDDDGGRPGGGRPGGGPPGGGPPDGGPPGRNRADLSLKKWVDDPLPAVGQVITYSIVISNSGPADAYDVQVLDRLPLGVVYSDSVATRGSYSVTTGLWDIELITVTEWLTLDVISVVTGTGRITNTTEITVASPFDPDSVPANTVTFEDDWNYVVITPTQSIDIEETNNNGQSEEEEGEAVEESNAAFIDPSQQVEAEQPDPATGPEGDNSSLPSLEIPTDAAERAIPATIAEEVETIPYIWPLLLAGGVLLIAVGVWLARR